MGAEKLIIPALAVALFGPGCAGKDASLEDMAAVGSAPGSVPPQPTNINNAPAPREACNYESYVDYWNQGFYVNPDLLEVYPGLCDMLDEADHPDEIVASVRKALLDLSALAQGGAFPWNNVPEGVALALRTSDVVKNKAQADLQIDDLSLKAGAAGGRYPIDMVPLDQPVCPGGEDTQLYFVLTSAPESSDVVGRPFQAQIVIPDYGDKNPDSEYHSVSSIDIDASPSNVAWRHAPVLISSYRATLAARDGEDAIRVEILPPCVDGVYPIDCPENWPGEPLESRSLLSLRIPVDLSGSCSE